MKQIYLIYGADAAWVTRETQDLINEILPKEMRDENLVEFLPTQGNSLSLEKVLAQALGELGIIPFLPDSQRVVVLHNVSDFLSGGAKGGRKPKAPKKTDKPAKAKPEGAAKTEPWEILAAFAERDLAATGNILIFSNIINMDRGESIGDKTHPLIHLIENHPLGRILSPPRYEKNPLFEMSDALLRRDAVAALTNFRQIYHEKTRSTPFYEILRNVRLLLQAKVLERLEQGGAGAETIDMKYLPSEKKLNLKMQSDFVRKKILASRDKFTLKELMTAMEKLLEINRFLFPSQKMTYVPDVKLLFETFIIEFCEGGQARRRTR